MKNLLFVLMGLCLFFACGKEELVTNEQLQQPKNTFLEKSGESTYDKIYRTDNLTDDLRIENGMLVFQDFKHFENVVEGLFLLQEQHEDDFLSTYEHLSNKELDIKAEEIEYEDYQPLVSFEKELGFRSRRAFIEEKIQNWLDNEELDFENNPDNLDSHSPVFRTVLNVSGNVKIGDEEIELIERWPFKKKCFRHGKEKWDAQSIY